MSSLGATFRREREARNISLEEIAAQTKIGIRLLRAIEEERFERLPGGIFSVSFVRQYARCLGMNEDVAVREYLQSVGTEREAVSTERHLPPEPPVSLEVTDYGRIIVAAIIVGVLAVGIGYGLYRLHGYLTAAPSAGDQSLAIATAPEPFPGSVPGSVEDSRELESAEEQPPAENPVNELAAPPGISAVSSVPAVPAPVVAPDGTSDVPRVPGELALRIDSHGAVWLSITADGVKQWQGTMRANQSREVQAAESIRLTVGDAAAVALTLNGKPLPALGRPGEVKNLTITAKTIPAP
jgi:cytoskeletal protein RodZ